MVEGKSHEMYKIENGYIVYPWTEQREENIEYLLRCDREIADRMVSLMQKKSAEYSVEFSARKMGVFSLFSTKRIKRYFRSQRQLIYFDAVTRRLWREHEELEEWASGK